MTAFLSRYELLNEIGVGGMGTVWRARDSATDGIVALKVLHPHLSRDPDYVRRFEREVKIAQRIDSPRVVRVLDSGSDEASHFLVMEYVAGKTLAQHIHEQGRLSIDEAIAISTAIAEALDAAHKLGIVHRDISPQNVLLQPDGTVKVTDFGVARDLSATAMTATSMMLGKPQYIAPEAVTGRSPIDIRSDIYALGVVIYQMLTGAVPFNAETPYAVMQLQVNQTPPPLTRLRDDIPGWLLGVVDRCLAKRPQDRYQTPHDLLLALDRGTPAREAQLAPARPQRGIVLLGVAGGVFVVIAILAAALLNSAPGTGSGPDGPALGLVASITAVLPAATLETTIVPTSTQLSESFDCEAVRGSQYRSPEERNWFQDHCLTSIPSTTPTLVATATTTVNALGNAIATSQAQDALNSTAASMTITFGQPILACGQQTTVVVRVFTSSGEAVPDGVSVYLSYSDADGYLRQGENVEPKSGRTSRGQVMFTFAARGKLKSVVTFRALVFKPSPWLDSYAHLSISCSPTPGPTLSSPGSG